MNPRVESKSITEEGNTLKFTLSNINVSLANALRRTILSDVPTVVFKTTPYEENKANIITNTSRFNNEIIKQRLGCIPIHITDLKMPLNNYLMEVKVENSTDTMRFVTTEDFKIKNITTDEYLSEKDTQNIFPPCNTTGYYIDFLRLRPRISDEIPGEAIHLTCEFSISNAKENGMYNVVSTCSYGCTTDDVEMEIKLGKKMNEWKNQGLKPNEIKFEADNWKLLDGLRIIKNDSFDFIIESIGVFSNQDIIKMSCDIIIEKLQKISNNIEYAKIETSENTMDNCYDFILQNEDYTIGKIIEFILYNKYFEESPILSYCGFKKMHPHDVDSIIRVAYKEPTEKSAIQGHIINSIEIAINIFTKIKKNI